ncbi:MAG: hypothetical protein ABI947_16135 [Chloroflexota bacterium]
MSAAQVLNALKPTDLYGWILYIIVALTIVAMVMQPDGSPLLLTFLLFGIILACLIDKITTTSQLAGTVPAFSKKSFGAFFIRVPMFVFPAIVAGMTKKPKSRGILIFTGLLGAVYFFARWFLEIRPQ